MIALLKAWQLNFCSVVDYMVTDGAKTLPWFSRDYHSVLPGSSFLMLYYNLRMGSMWTQPT